MKDNFDNTFKHITSQAKKVGLSAREKHILFNTIDSHISSHTRRERSVASPFFANHMFMFSRQVFAVVAVVVVIFGSGTSFVAASALPGDLLYAFKINVNEKVAPLFLSGHQKTEFEVRLAGERIKEAVTLASQGRLDEEKKVAISTLLDKHTSRISQNIDSLEHQGQIREALAVSETFKNTLRHSSASLSPVQEDVTIAVKENKKNNDSSVVVQEKIEQTVSVLDSRAENYKIQILAEDTRNVALANLQNIDSFVSTHESFTESAATPLSSKLASPPSPSVSAPAISMALKSTKPIDAPSLKATAPTPSSLLLQAKIFFDQGEEAYKNKDFLTAADFYGRATDLFEQIKLMFDVESVESVESIDNITL